MALTIQDIQEAAKRIVPYAARTPMLRLQSLDSFLGCQVYAKAECMQVTGSFKYRGAMNKILSLSKEELNRGIIAASSGNHGKAIAYACRMLGVKATIVLPYTAAQVKVDTIQGWGAETVRCEVSERFEVAERICRERGATLIPPYNDEAVMAGQGTAGLELMEQCPELDMVIVPTSGGGLIGGVSTAVKALSPKTKVYGAEPAVLPRYSVSVAAGHPVKVPVGKSVADALVSNMPGTICFPVVAAHVDGFAAVDDAFLLQGMKLLLMEGKILCEPSSAIGIGAVLQGLLPIKPEDKVCFLISGGSVSLEQLRALV
ncbi:MAG: threonine/serine dehydratase [Clostridia bacterium]|nr:threonine/serine dehydratase [Clostridia bacterium]